MAKKKKQMVSPKPPTPGKLLQVAEEQQEFLDRSIAGHEKNLLRAITRLEKKIIDQVKDFKTSSGALMGPKVNMKQAQAVHKKLKRLFDEEYGSEVQKIVRGFQSSERYIEKEFKDLNMVVDYVGVDKDVLRGLKENVWNNFNQFGLQAQDQLVKGMYDAIIGKMPFSQLVENVSGVLSGFRDAKGRSMARYAKLYANDAIMDFHNQVTLKKAQDIDVEWFLYYGNIMDTTRRFCRTRAGNVYNINDINSWDSQNWSGKSGPALTNRGGYNCRHSWVPVRPDWIKDPGKFGAKGQLEDDVAIPIKDRVLPLKKKATEAEKAKKVLGTEGQPLSVRRARKAELMAGGPYFIEDLTAMSIADLKQYASGLNLNVFGWKKGRIIEEVAKVQKDRLKAIVPKKRGKGRPPGSKNKKIKPQKAVVKKIEKELTREAREKQLDEMLIKKKAELERLAVTYEGETGDWRKLRIWNKIAAHRNSENITLRTAHKLHEEVFELEIEKYKNLSVAGKVRERETLLKHFVDSGRNRYDQWKNTYEEGVRHMSYRSLKELDRAGVGIRYRHVNGRAGYYDSTRVIEVYKNSTKDTFAHEFAHAVDGLFSTHGGIDESVMRLGRSVSQTPQTGFVWADGGKYVTPKQRDMLRKEYESLKWEGAPKGTYRNGDGKYWRGNWIDDYEGRIYNRVNHLVTNPEIRTSADVVRLDPTGQEWFAMNVQRYNAAVRSGKESYRRRVKNLTEALEERKQMLTDRVVKTGDRDLFKEGMSSLKKELKTLTAGGESAVVKDTLANDTTWLSVKRKSPQLAEFIDELFTKILAN